ncbi:uncharacterized protein [Anas acuta]|uniref:uncharacterized protein isoform X4 n=1 Tax=Anas acuta TaxID=28680 RepID=UPI0035C87FBB
MALRWSLLLALTPLLAAEKMERDEAGYRENRRQAVCPKPEWDSSLRFVPEKTSYDNGEELTLSCLTEDDPPLAVIRCVEWMGWGHAWEVKDKWGRWLHIEMYWACTGTCQKPQWDRRVVLVPKKGSYTPNEELRLSCPEGFKPSFTSAKCVREFQGVTSGEPVYGDSWWGRSSTGAWTRIEEPVACVVKCSRPQWDADIRLAPERDVYEEGEEVTLSCPEGSLLPFQQAKCAWRPRAVPKGEHQGTWIQKNELGKWVPIQSPTMCISTCQKPLWDPRLRLAPEQEVYKENAEVTLSCPEGFEPSFTHIKCSREDQSISAGKPVYREFWKGKDPGGAWTRIRSMVQCAFQVVPGTLEVSTTSIKLNWTCSLLDVCQRMQATCRLAGPSSPSCEAEEVTAQEMLHGQNGTFTCDHLQSFTVYNVTISVSPSTILFTQLLRTKATVPEKPERLWLNVSTGTLRWQALPSCKGEILGYQLNVTAWGPQDGGFLQVERLRLSSSVTEHPLPAHGPGTRYTVAVWGLTAAGAGAALLGDFQSNGSDTAAPPDASSRLVRDISPSQGTAVLRLRPIPWVPGAAREHQLLVAATHKSTALEDACSGEPQPFDASRPSDAYVAAVLNLSAETDFVLGDGTRRHGFHNAPLRPGWDYTALLRLEWRSQQEETFACVCYSFSVGQPPGPWPWTAVTVVAVLSAMVMLSAGILGFVMCRRRKALPRKAEEDHYTELQPYENSDLYCVIKERFPAEEEAGRGGRAGERPSPSLRRTLGDHCGCQRAETAGRTTPA